MPTLRGIEAESLFVPPPLGGQKACSKKPVVLLHRSTNVARPKNKKVVKIKTPVNFTGVFYFLWLQILVLQNAY
jgi:hypothetical protein